MNNMSPHLLKMPSPMGLNWMRPETLSVTLVLNFPSPICEMGSRVD